MTQSWTENARLAELRTDALSREGVVFEHEGYLYRTTGAHLSQGGMGAVVHMERYHPGEGGVEAVVAKTFHSQYLYQLRTDEITRRDHAVTMAAFETLRSLGHPHLLPTYISAPIADNHIFVTPKMADTLLEATVRGRLSQRQRVELLIQSLRGLASLHEKRLIHRDYTLRNILVDERGRHAFLFDFDLLQSLEDIGPRSYKEHYKGRIFGSPGCSVPPEMLDPGLMECAISTRIDIYAIGGALFSLFTDQSPYGNTQDMWSLLMKISEGVVFSGSSKIAYPEAVPEVVRPIIEACLERDPGNRYGSVNLIVEELTQLLDDLADDEGQAAHSFHTTSIQISPLDPKSRIDSVHRSRQASDVNMAVIELVDRAVGRLGYQLRRNLGQIRGFPIFLAHAIPELVASGQFPDANTYPKIVTAINLNRVPNPNKVYEDWFGHFWPVLSSIRQGLITSLHKVSYDEKTGFLLLFSEYVDGAKFGPDLAEHDLTIEESLSLAFLVVRQVARLHEHGVAHNNVRPESLLLKGISRSREVHPGMVGLVTPSRDPEAISADVRNLAALTSDLIRSHRVDALEPRTRGHIDHMRAEIGELLYRTEGATEIGELLAAIANGLARLDFNFDVLREHGGDLQAYVLMLLSHRLYPRLFER